MRASLSPIFCHCTRPCTVYLVRRMQASPPQTPDVFSIQLTVDVTGVCWSAVPDRVVGLGPMAWSPSTSPYYSRLGAERATAGVTQPVFKLKRDLRWHGRCHFAGACDAP